MPVPITAAVQATVELGSADDALQVTLTSVTVGDATTAIVATALLVTSWVLLTETVTELPVVGNVRTPSWVMLPAEVDQVTAEE